MSLNRVLMLKSFQLSFTKGWSRAKRLTSIIKDLHAISVQYKCILEPIWISTHDNVGADALSRQDMNRFYEWAREHIPNKLERAK